MKKNYIVFTERNNVEGKIIDALSGINITYSTSLTDNDALEDVESILVDTVPQGEDIDWQFDDGVFGKGGYVGHTNILGTECEFHLSLADAEDLKNILDDEKKTEGQSRPGKDNNMEKYFYIFTENNDYNGEIINALSGIYMTNTAYFSDEDAVEELVSVAEEIAPNGEFIDWIFGDGIFGKGGISGRTNIAGTKCEFTFSLADTEDLKNILDDEKYE